MPASQTQEVEAAETGGEPAAVEGCLVAEEEAAREEVRFAMARLSAAGEDAGADELSADYHPAAGEDAGVQEPPAAATAHGVIQGSGPSPNSRIHKCLWKRASMKFRKER